MPDKKLLDDVVHDLKQQIASTRTGTNSAAESDRSGPRLSDQLSRFCPALPWLDSLEPDGRQSLNEAGSAAGTTIRRCGCFCHRSVADRRGLISPSKCHRVIRRNLPGSSAGRGSCRAGNGTRLGRSLALPESRKSI